MSTMPKYEVTARVDGKLTTDYSWGYNVADAQQRFKQAQNSKNVSFISCKKVS
jgi:hypothetical protein